MSISIRFARFEPALALLTLTPADYVRVGEDFGEFTFRLTGDAFPSEITVFANAAQSAILSRPSATEIDIILPGGIALAPGFTSVRVYASDSRFSNALPIEVRRQ